MATLTIALTGLAFYFAYHSSQRATPTRFLRIERWISFHPAQAKWISLVLLCVSLALAVSVWGWGAGVLTFMVILMTLGSLIVLLSPMRLLTYRSIALFLIISLIAELSL